MKLSPEDVAAAPEYIKLLDAWSERLCAQAGEPQVEQHLGSKVARLLEKVFDLEPKAPEVSASH